MIPYFIWLPVPHVESRLLEIICRLLRQRILQKIFTSRFSLQNRPLPYDLWVSSEPTVAL